MELDGGLYDAVNGNKKFERYEDHPIVPEMVEPVTLFNEDLIKMTTDGRRESNFSLQSDISLETTESENSMTNIKFFRTPSVVVSDHSEDTGCITYDDIGRIASAYHRRRRYRPTRRHSDAYESNNTMNERNEFARRSESGTSGSGIGETTPDYYTRSSQSVTSLNRTKNMYCGDEPLEDYDPDGHFDGKTLSECSSLNELSPIMSQYGSSNCSENSSRRSSIFSEISPVFLRKNLSHGDFQKEKNFGTDTKTTISSNHNKNMINPTFAAYFNERDPNVLDEADILMLEQQRSLSYDDLNVDTSGNSDISYSDLSVDFSACSSLSNLPGTVYYCNYNPNHGYNGNYGLDEAASKQLNVRLTKKTANQVKNGNIKTSKSCSDFLSVSRIEEDYPHLKHRRHSNDQVTLTTTFDYCSRRLGSCKDDYKKKWPLTAVAANNVTKSKMNNATFSNDNRINSRVKNAWGKLLTLHLKSFHESLNFQKENYIVSKRKSKSNECVFRGDVKKTTDFDELDKIRNVDEKNYINFASQKISRRRFGNDDDDDDGVEPAAAVVSESENDAVVKNEKKIPVKKDWLSVKWKNGQVTTTEDGDTKSKFLRKISNCSTCSDHSGYRDAPETLQEITTKTKVR